MRRTRIGLLAMLFAGAASAAPIDLVFDSPTESKTLTSALSSGSPIHVDGALVAAGGIDDNLTFRAGSSTLSLSAGWLVAPASNRTVGVNIDLLDAFDNVVASDVFIGSDGTLASSRLNATGLVAGGLYRLRFTGTGVGLGRYHVDLVDGPVAPPIPTVAPATPNVDAALFDTARGSKTFPNRFDAGDQFVIDGKLQDGGAIADSFQFVVTSGTMSAGIEWVVGTLTDPQRTVGFNVDLFDALHTLVASDTFMGLIDGQAFSQFVVTGLAPGIYTLAFTGTAPNGRGRYRMDLSTNATPPGFRPIVDASPTAVPEPDLLGLAAAGALALLMVRRLRRVRTGAALRRYP